MDGGLNSVKSKCFTNSLPSSALNLFPVLVSPCLRCFSSLFSHLLSLRSLPFLFILYSTEAETDARAASEERESARERERARERECWSVGPCGLEWTRERARVRVCVCEKEWQWVSWSERKRRSGMREGFADWLAGSQLCGPWRAWLERVRPLSGLRSEGSSSARLERWSLPSIPRSLPSPLPPFSVSPAEKQRSVRSSQGYANHPVFRVSRETCLFQTNALADVLC